MWPAATANKVPHSAEPHPTMTQPPPIVSSPDLREFQIKKDREHMKILAILHFTNAGLKLLGILFLCLHFSIMSSIFLNPKIWENVNCPDETSESATTPSASEKPIPAPSAESPAVVPNDETLTPGTGHRHKTTRSSRPIDPEIFRQFFKLFIWFYVFMGVFFVIGMVLNILSGIWMLKRKNRVFSFVVAGLNCMNLPLGTLLGVFTIMVLMRDSVQQSYEQNQA